MPEFATNRIGNDDEGSEAIQRNNQNINNDLYGSENGYEGGDDHNESNQDAPTLELIKLQRKNTVQHNNDALTEFLRNSQHHPDCSDILFSIINHSIISNHLYLTFL